MQYRRFQANTQRYLLYLTRSILCLLSLASAATLWAQTDPETELLINRLTMEEREDGLALSIYFTLLNQDGIALERERVDGVSLLLDDGARYTPTLIEAESPLYITLLIDTGSALAGTLPALEAGLINGLQQASPEALFGVTSFDTVITPQLMLTNDRVALVNSLRTLEAGGDDACPYDALYSAVQALQLSGAGDVPARRALILFTNNGEDRCSTFGPDQIIRLAQGDRPNLPVSIYVVGLDTLSDRADMAGLADIVQRTGGRFMYGRADRVETQLAELFSGFRQQMLAEVVVYPQQGRRALTLNLFSQNDLLGTGAAPFFANQSWTAPVDAVTTLRLEEVVYDPVEDLFQLRLPLDRPDEIAQLTVSIWDENQGVQLNQYSYRGFTSDAVIEVPGAGMVAGKKYALRVGGTDMQGEPLLNSAAEPSLLTHSVTYSPVEVPIRFLIDAQSLDAERELLTLDVVQENGRPAVIFDGRIENEETGMTVQTFRLPADPRIIIPIDQLPDGKYRIRLRGLDSDAQLIGEVENRFVYLRPAGDPFFRRLGRGLVENGWLFGLMGLAVAGLVLFAVQQRRAQQRLTSTPFLSGQLRRNFKQQSGVETSPSPLYKTALRSESEPDRTPPGTGPLAGAERLPSGSPSRSRPGSPQGNPSLFIRSTGGRPVDRSLIQLTHIPFTIGRQGCDFNFDTKTISRQHVQFIEHDRELYIRDTGSSNGTFLNEQPLKPDLPYRLEDGAEIRLGSELVLVFETGL